MADVALGLKAHSGWAALVALSIERQMPKLVDRRRIELVDAAEASWAKQPYHAAAGLEPREAEALVGRAIAAARRLAAREVGAAVESLRLQRREVVGIGILVGTRVPEWTVAQILSVHARMHKAEGELFRGALVHAGERCGLAVTRVAERDLQERAAKALHLSAAALPGHLAAIGRASGPPWARDQKDAALAAWLALSEHSDP
jgi:hypothetical protein